MTSCSEQVSIRRTLNAVLVPSPIYDPENIDFCCVKTSELDGISPVSFQFARLSRLCRPAIRTQAVEPRRHNPDKRCWPENSRREWVCGERVSPRIVRIAAMAGSRREHSAALFAGLNDQDERAAH